jgi:hypothetical protein
MPFADPVPIEFPNGGDPVKAEGDPQEPSELGNMNRLRPRWLRRVLIIVAALLAMLILVGPLGEGVRRACDRHLPQVCHVFRGHHGG